MVHRLGWQTQYTAFADAITICYHFLMKAAHRRTLIAIFSNPTPSNLAWRQIEALFIALGAQVIEGRGSRVRFELEGVIATFHRPHPHKEAKPYQVRDAREFLTQAGIRP
jgi:hypothetical protein